MIAHLVESMRPERSTLRPGALSVKSNKHSEFSEIMKGLEKNESIINERRI